MCPHTSTCVSSYYYMCPHTTIIVSSYYYLHPHTTINLSSYYCLYPHTTINVSSYYYISKLSTAAALCAAGVADEEDLYLSACAVDAHADMLVQPTLQQRRSADAAACNVACGSCGSCCCSACVSMRTFLLVKQVNGVPAAVAAGGGATASRLPLPEPSHSCTSWPVTMSCGLQVAGCGLREAARVSYRNAMR